MATFLYRVGRFCFGHRWAVLGAWAGVLVAALAGMALLQKPTSDAFSIPGTPAQQAIDLLAERFPQAGAQASGATARVVFSQPGNNTRLNQEAVDRAVNSLKGLPQVASVTGLAPNADGSVAYTQVTFTVPAAELTGAARQGLDDVLMFARADGLIAEVGGDAVQSSGHAPVGEVVGLIVAALVLIATFRSPAAAGLPLLTAIIGVALGFAGIGIATRFADLSSTTSSLAMMLGLAVAIDYALFIVSRYRIELALGRDRMDAAGRAAGTAGNAVVFAGLTVIIALAGLAVAGIPFLTQMGVAAAGTVAVAVVIALTLLPALLAVAGHRINPAPVRDRLGKPAFGVWWVRLIARRPVVALLATVIGLGVVAIPAHDLRLGLPTDGSAAADTSPRRAYDLLTDGFGPGFNGPLTVLATPGTSVEGLAGVAMVVPSATNEAGDTEILTVIPTTGPQDAATEDLVHRLRNTSGVLGVTGTTAINVDVSEKLSGALLPYLALVVGLAFVLLALVFRSLLVPLKATLGFLLSVAATFGALVAVFQWGWQAWLLGITQTGPIISFLPILLIGIVFGLAMDYQVFLVTRMREDFVHGAPARQAVVSGFGHGARVVTAAALIMMSVFFGFMLGPEAIIKSIGFGLGVAILFDAIVVRMILVPAVMLLVGKAAWWLPGWLDRVLPDVDVEGEKLARHLDEHPPPADPLRYDHAEPRDLTRTGEAPETIESAGSRPI
ncbi:MMPL family transporter [Paractinoplanes lichenicola]|uniref:MMPL family transporter n=1 Tax=Paractinoplanes lichenicola TaxID=2802976 RepID=A0ABS1VTL0_9ACTN|nr:MMPL family transporter [Actinoplanes lichenicola]MBL7257812.1 MMPL family transporter [Actinoplanes lichenicola]